MAEKIDLPNYRPPDPAKVARKRGGGIQKAYSGGLRHGEALMQARDEATNAADRRALDEALSYHYKAHDLVTRVLGGQ